MIVKCHKTFEVCCIIYGGQGFRDEIKVLGTFETRAEAEDFIEEKCNGKGYWTDFKIRERLRELGS